MIYALTHAHCVTILSFYFSTIWFGTVTYGHKSNMITRLLEFSITPSYKRLDSIHKNIWSHAIGELSDITIGSRKPTCWVTYREYSPHIKPLIITAVCVIFTCSSRIMGYIGRNVSTGSFPRSINSPQNWGIFSITLFLLWKLLAWCERRYIHRKILWCLCQFNQAWMIQPSFNFLMKVGIYFSTITMINDGPWLDHSISQSSNIGVYEW